MANHEICRNSKTDQKLRAFVPTKRLLDHARYVSHLVCDGTYKLIWQGYPVLVVGTTDRMKMFHPFGLCVTLKEEASDFEFLFSSLKKSIFEIYKIDLGPRILVADGAAAETNGLFKRSDQQKSE